MKTTFGDKTFIVIDNEAIIRRDSDLSAAEKYKAGDPLPVGAKVGDPKVIPKRTEIRVTAVRTDGKKVTFVRAEPVATDAICPSGWTRASNLEGKFENEVVGFAPAALDIDDESCFTVTDSKALVRGGPAGFASTGKSVPVGTLVRVKEASKGTTPPGKFVRIVAVRADNPLVDGDEIGWTSAGNLMRGAYAIDPRSWSDTKGSNACWKKGRFIGSQVIANIVGTGGEMEQVTLVGLEAYLALFAAAAKTRIPLAIESGFRTFAKQKELFDGWKAGKPGFNRAAPPGGSNHQNGVAFDLNTRGYDGDPTYDWLKKNGPKLGFIRTVTGEHWHWEYDPEQAKALAKAGNFKTSNVRR